MKTKTERLSNEELFSLNRELRSNYFTAISAYLMILILIHILIYISYNQWTIPEYEIILVVSFTLLIFLLTKSFTRDLRSEIAKGEKKIEIYIVDKKYEYIDKDGLYSSEFTKFIIIAEGKRFVVKEEQYTDAKISDCLVVHKSLLREIVLKTEIVKSPAPNNESVCL